MVETPLLCATTQPPTAFSSPLSRSSLSRAPSLSLVLALFLALARSERLSLALALALSRSRSLTSTTHAAGSTRARAPHHVVFTTVQPATMNRALPPCLPPLCLVVFAVAAHRHARLCAPFSVGHPSLHADDIGNEGAAKSGESYVQHYAAAYPLRVLSGIALD